MIGGQYVKGKDCIVFFYLDSLSFLRKLTLHFKNLTGGSKMFNRKNVLIVIVCVGLMLPLALITTNAQDETSNKVVKDNTMNKPRAIKVHDKTRNYTVTEYEIELIISETKTYHDKVTGIKITVNAATQNNNHYRVYDSTGKSVFHDNMENGKALEVKSDTGYPTYFHAGATHASGSAAYARITYNY